MTKEEMNVELARVLASKTNRPSRRDESVSEFLKAYQRGQKFFSQKPEMFMNGIVLKMILRSMKKMN